MTRRTLRIGMGGFGLIEIMVGLVIGLIAVLVIGEVTAVFEGQKRTSTGGSDAQVNGTTALTTIAHELMMAGNGLVVWGLGGTAGTQFCPLGTYIYNAGAAPTQVAQPSDAYHGLVPPVRIFDGGRGPDSIEIMRSDSEFGQLAMLVRAFDASASPPYVTVDAWPDANFSAANRSKVPGQLFLIGKSDGSKPCRLLQVSGIDLATGNNWTNGIPASTLNFANSGSYPYNPPYVATDYWTYSDGDMIVNVGKSANYDAATKEGNLTVDHGGFSYRRYGVFCGKLAVVDPTQVAGSGGTYDCTNTSPMVDEIVDLEAQYGIAPPNTQNVTEWRDATGAWAPTALTAASIARIKAIRIAVVARSPQLEKLDTTLYPPDGYVSPATITLWTAFANSDPAPVFTVPDRQYRYKVFTTVVPIKGVIWGQL